MYENSTATTARPDSHNFKDNRRSNKDDSETKEAGIIV